MYATHLLLEEPIRMASILEPSKPSFFPAMTKIVGTLGPKSRSVEVISSCLKTGMSVAIKRTKNLCTVMLDTLGPELQVINRSENAISLQADDKVVLTPDQEKEASSELLPINFSGLAKWKYWILEFCKYTSLSSQGILSPPTSRQRRRAASARDSLPSTSSAVAVGNNFRRPSPLRSTLP